MDVPLIDADVAVEEGPAPAGDAAPAEDRPGDEALQQVEIPERLVVDEELEISATSPLQDLRRICRFFGINQSGSKRKMY